jgi:hypothetical protein
MWLAPYHRERFFSPLSPATVYARVAGRMPATLPPRSNVEEPWYGGEASEEAFCLQRLISYRNSFLPEISGEVVPVAGGSVVDLRLRLTNGVLLFMSTWLLAVGFLLLATLGREYAAAQAGASFSWGALGPLWFMVFGYGLMTSGFWWEARLARRHISALLQAEKLPN